MKGSSYIYIVIMLIMLIIIGWSLGMKYFATKLLPLSVGSIVFILAAVGLMREILGGNEQKVGITKDETSTGKQARQEWLGYLIHGGWLAGFFLAIYLLGFMVSMPLFILFYMRFLGTRWRVAITCAVLTPLILYAILDFSVGITLYRGLLLIKLGF